MDENVFEGSAPHPALPELGRAIFLDENAPSGSPANYEELRGCPSPEGWTKFGHADSPEAVAAAVAGLRDRLVDRPLTETADV